MARRITQALAIIPILLATTVAVATPRDKTVETLKGISQNDAFGLEAWLDGGNTQIRVGEQVDFRFRAATDAYLTTVYVDAAGAVAVLHSGSETNRISAGQIERFPPPNSKQRLVAQAPLGSEFIFVVATLEPLPQDMFADTENKLIFSYERPEDGRHLARRLADYVSILPEGSVDVAWFAQDIVPEDTPRRYSSTNIVEHFTTQTRSLTRPKLDLDIQFQFGSEELTEDAKKDLDQLGQALEHPAMKNRRFELAGHTDDVGAEKYNMQLSKKRAQAALDYLRSKYKVSPDSVRPAGYGEARPVMPGTSDEARRRNRRVVIEQLP